MPPTRQLEPQKFMFTQCWSLDGFPAVFLPLSSPFLLSSNMVIALCVFPTQLEVGPPPMTLHSLHLPITDPSLQVHSPICRCSLWGDGVHPVGCAHLRPCWGIPLKEEIYVTHSDTHPPWLRGTRTLLPVGFSRLVHGVLLCVTLSPPPHSAPGGGSSMSVPGGSLLAIPTLLP